MHDVHSRHERRFAANRFVYPVISRRSGGLSIGVNLNPDKICNFDCIYCQVDRRSPAEVEFVELPRLLDELEVALQLAVSGEIYADARFRDAPAALRRLNDIAFSGDGEPTTYRNFDRLIEACAEVKRRTAPAGVKMVLITNASMFHRPAVLAGLETLQANDGQIWAKLDAGTEDYFRRIDRTPIPFRQVLDNLTAVARRWPIVIQSLFMRVNGEPPPAEEIAQYVRRLQEILEAGGAISHVQVYTIARRPAESFVSALADAEVDAIAAAVRNATGLQASSYYGSNVEPQADEKESNDVGA